MNSAPILSCELLSLLSKPLEQVFVIDGNAVKDKASFFNAIAVALHFPAHFGLNWDAMLDCMTDLEWLNLGAGFSIIYNNSQPFRAAHPDDWAIANEILLDSQAYWCQQHKTMLLAFV